MKLSPQIAAKLQEAWAHENHNSLTYKHIESVLAVAGYKKLSAYYGKWAEEEHQHSEWVLQFLKDMNIPLGVKTIDVSQVGDDVFKIPDITMKIEDSTTQLWQEIYRLSQSDYSLGCGMVATLALKLLAEQVEETGKAQDLVDQFTNLGGLPAFLQIYDNSFEG